MNQWIEQKNDGNGFVHMLVTEHDERSRGSDKPIRTYILLDGLPWHVKHRYIGVRTITNNSVSKTE